MNELEIETRDGALTFRLRVTPGARRSRILGTHGGALKLSVAEPPENSRANEGVIRMLAKALDISASQIKISAGHASRDKRVALKGLSQQEVRDRLAETGET